MLSKITVPCHDHTKTLRAWKESRNPLSSLLLPGTSPFPLPPQLLLTSWTKRFNLQYQDYPSSCSSKARWKHSAKTQTGANFFRMSRSRPAPFKEVSSHFWSSRETQLSQRNLPRSSDSFLNQAPAAQIVGCEECQERLFISLGLWCQHKEQIQIKEVDCNLSPQPKPAQAGTPKRVISPRRDTEAPRISLTTDSIYKALKSPKYFKF